MHIIIAMKYVKVALKEKIKLIFLFYKDKLLKQPITYIIIIVINNIVKKTILIQL